MGCCIFLALIWFYGSVVSSTPQWYNYTQKFDHFRGGGLYETNTFQQRFIVDPTHWSGSHKNGPFLVNFGGEQPITDFVGHVGIINEAAPRLQALVVYIEHRFYGRSVPFGSIDTAFIYPEVRSYLTSEQALADFSDIILTLKAQLLSENSPVIVLGGSYAGMLAAWFRLKYPHVATGALASSAPVLYFENISPEKDFCSMVTNDFEQVNPKCVDIIRQSWSIIDEIASRVDGLTVLTNTFKLCRPLLSAYELKALLVHMYTFAAQYNGRYDYWINSVCEPIVRGSNPNIIEGLVNALAVMNYKDSCVPIDSMPAASAYDVLDTSSLKAWSWQQCSEIVVIQGCDGYNSMLPREFFSNLTEYMEDCRGRYDTLPRLDWVPAYYGGRDRIKAGSNIIFSNGLMDPFSSAGILEDLSDTVVAVVTKQGSHSLDMNMEKEDDPNWLVEQRAIEIKIFEKWLKSKAPKTTLPIKHLFIIHVILLLLLLVCFV